MPDELDVFEDDQEVILPTVDEEPVRGGDPVPPGVRLEIWKISTAEAIADSFLEYFYKHPVTEIEQRHPSWGASLLYWRHAAAFAYQLWERQNFAPGIQQIENRCYPAWQAVFNERTQEAFINLAACMPPLCRAIRTEHRVIDTEDPAELLLSFIDAVIDHLVRARLLRRRSRLEARKKSTAPLHRQWLKSIRNGTLSYLSGAEPEVEHFAESVRSWLGYLRPTRQESSWRLGFHVHPPEEEEGTWEIGYYLRSAQNPSLRLPARAIWSAGPDSTVWSHVPNAVDVLLADLGTAVDLFPEVRHSLETARPESCLLSRRQALDFLADTAPLLQRHGYPVTLPEWWEEGQSNLSLRLRVATPGSGENRDRKAVLGVDQLVAFKWEVTLGERQLSADDMQRLAKSRQSLIYHNGRWVRLDLEALRRSAELLRQRGMTGEASLVSLLRYGDELRRETELPGFAIDLDEAVTDFFDRLRTDASFELLDPPANLNGQLRPYQVKGYAWMMFVSKLGFGACLADDMGLGKTVQMIAVMLQQQQQGDLESPSLVVCPMSVVGNWLREINRFGPSLTVMVHHGSDRFGPGEFGQAARQHDVVVTTYALALRDRRLLAAITWHDLVLDEAQNIKNPTTKQAAAVRSLKAHHRFSLTGTPIENRLSELWSIMNFLNPGYLGTLAAFRSAFSQPIERDADPDRAELLQQIIRPFVLRRLKSDREIIRDLPEKQEMKVYCNLTVEQASLYQAIVEEMLGSLRTAAGIARRGLVLSTLTKLKQITNHPAHFLHDGSPLDSERSGKLQRLEEMLEVVLEEDDRALIFTQFTEFGTPLRRKLEKRFGVEVLYLHGGTPQGKRDEMVAHFQEGDGPPLFLLSLKAGGFGLNLTAANHVFHFDRWWNPAVEDQATDRAFRIGQTRNVQVHKFICVGTVEERIDQMIEEKKNLAANIVTVGESMLTELSTDRLQEIFTLTRDAVV